MALHNDYQNPRRIAVERSVEKTKREHQREAVLRYRELLNQLTTARHAYSTARALREFDGDEPIRILGAKVSEAQHTLDVFLADLGLGTPETPR